MYPILEYSSKYLILEYYAYFHTYTFYIYPVFCTDGDVGSWVSGRGCPQSCSLLQTDELVGTVRDRLGLPVGTNPGLLVSDRRFSQRQWDLRSQWLWRSHLRFVVAESFRWMHWEIISVLVPPIRVSRRLTTGWLINLLTFFAQRTKPRHKRWLKVGVNIVVTSNW